MSRPLVVLAIVGLLVGTAGCAARKIYGEDVSRIEAARGDDIVIALAANPTTGYAWMPGKTDPAILTLVGSDYEPPPSAALGAGGRQLVTFRAVGRGTTTLQLDYRRPWESTAPAKSAIFTIVVR